MEDPATLPTVDGAGADARRCSSRPGEPWGMPGEVATLWASDVDDVLADCG